MTTDATDAYASVRLNALRGELQGVLDAEMGYDGEDFPYLAQQLAEAAAAFLDAFGPPENGEGHG